MKLLSLWIAVVAIVNALENFPRAPWRYAVLIFWTLVFTALPYPPPIVAWLRWLSG